MMGGASRYTATQEKIVKNEEKDHTYRGLQERVEISYAIPRSTMETRLSL